MLDLDTVAWVTGKVGVLRDPIEAAHDVRLFCAGNKSFVIEGCYEDLIAAAFPYRPHLLFLDVSAEICERHCRARPFEPHKYASMEPQSAKLEFLLQWVRDYYTRPGRMSRTEHLKLFESYSGPKSRFEAEVTLGKTDDIICSA